MPRSRGSLSDRGVLKTPEDIAEMIDDVAAHKEGSLLGAVVVLRRLKHMLASLDPGTCCSVDVQPDEKGWNFLKTSFAPDARCSCCFTVKHARLRKVGLICRHEQPLNTLCEEAI